jgi:hypothetical protein
LALHIEDPEEGSIAGDIRDSWLLASRRYFLGCVPVGLDEAVETEEEKRIVSSAIESLLKRCKMGQPNSTLAL